MALLETLNDSFSSGTLDTTKWTNISTTGTATVTGGVLQCTTQGLGIGGVQSAATFDIATGSYLLAKVVTNNPDSAVTVLKVRCPPADTGGYSLLQVNNNTLAARSFAVGGAGGTVWSTAYDSVAHAWLRLRFGVAGTSITTFFDTSPDGVNWTQRASSTNNWTGTQAQAILQIDYNGVSTSRTATFDRVNLPYSGYIASSTPGLTATWTRDAFVSGASIPAGPAATWTHDFASSFTRVAAALQIVAPIPNEIRDPETLGGPTLTQPVTLSPASLSNPETLATPDAVFKSTINPTGLTDPQAIGAPTTATQLSATPDGIANPETLGSPTAAITIKPTPDSLTDAETLGTPGTLTGQDATPDSIGEPETLGEPDITAPPLVLPAIPDALNDLEQFAAPDLRQAYTIGPATLGDPDTLTNPHAGADITTAPATIGDTQTVGAATLALGMTAALEGITDTETLDALTLDGPLYPIQPDAATDAETLTGPTLSIAPAHLPDSTGDPETLNAPTVEFRPPPPLPASLSDPQTLGAPALRFAPSKIYPASINDQQAFGAPSLKTTLHYNGAYSTGDYGVGTYQGMNFSPNGIVDFGLLGQPAILSVPAPPTNAVLPLGINDAETFAEPEAPRFDATNLNYGAGTYNYGPYVGQPGTTTDDNPRDNPSYSEATYGYGPYYGETVATKPEDTLPLFRTILGAGKPPLHLLGIGPSHSLVDWRGAPNYGVTAHPATTRASNTSPTLRSTTSLVGSTHPELNLPPATGKGFTLRLGEGGEAHCELNLTRGSAIIIDEMDTDLWWRRKDPRTGTLEMIGRYNTAHVNLSTSDTGINASIQFVDYQTLLGDRMVLDYLEEPVAGKPQTQWAVGTLITDILTWALPNNTNIDLTDVTSALIDLGKTTHAFDIAPGTTIDDVIDNLQAVSPHRWEWWIEAPLDVTQAPKLRVTIGQRGTDKGITLFDVGKGPTPIASWTRNSATDDYANTLLYTGGGSGDGAKAGGGVVVDQPDDIARYGQRDALYGNSSVPGGNIDVLQRRARQKLAQLADRRPNYTIRLRQGFWRGRHHIDIGDTIALHLRLGKDALYDKYRVSEITVDIDDNGLEDVTLNLGRLPTSADPRSRRAPLARVLRALKNYDAPGDIMTRPPTPDT